MNETTRIMRAGAIGAGIAGLSLIVMAFFSEPGGMNYPGLPALTGVLQLSGAEQSQYIRGMETLYLLDGIFLMGWLVGWVGLAAFVGKRNPVFGWLTLGFGLAGAMFDLGENSIIWGVLQNYQLGLSTGTDWVVSWKAVQHLSYWLPFAGAIFASCGLWCQKWFERAVALVGTLLTAGAMIGLYFPAFSMASNVWFLVWFASISLLLWRRSTGSSLFN